MTFLVSVRGRWPKVIASAGDSLLLHQHDELQKRLLRESHLPGDRVGGGGRLEHPHRNLQSFAYGVNDGNGSIPSLRPAKDSQAVPTKGMKGIKNLNVRGIRTQGIMRDDGRIPTFTV
jgi:hypothetical protein